MQCCAKHVTYTGRGKLIPLADVMSRRAKQNMLYILTRGVKTPNS
jgi:hypothetical protein